MIRRQHVVRDFFPEAEAMREALDKDFRNPYERNVSWHYYCVPQHYTYLRTSPPEAIPATTYTLFMQHLRQWCLENLGQVPIGTPWLHLMVNGCKLELHSDFHNGTWGYVYSLTRWQNRTFSGGETLLMRDGIPSYKKHHVHGDVLYELIPAQFNQLLVFDDRIVHSTPVIEGSMNPLEGRIALVGHLRATSPVVSGLLPAAAARAVIQDMLPRLSDQIKEYKDVQGTITFRLTIGSTGTVESVTTLTDNIITPATGYEPSEAVTTVKSIIQQTISALRFPAIHGESSIIVPVLVPLPDLHPIEITVPYELPREAVYRWALARLGDGGPLSLQGSWEGETFAVREPIAGNLRIETGRIAISFDAPMWVPSQRDKFQMRLMERLQAALADATRNLARSK